MQTCSVCGAYKPFEAFNHQTRPRKDGTKALKRRCKSCCNEARKAWARRNPEKFKRAERNARLRYCFGITNEQYDAMLKKQIGLCAICGLPPGRRRLAVDHDHTTGRVRGLLCTRCNQTLGLVGDSRALLRAASAYLREHT